MSDGAFDINAIPGTGRNPVSEPGHVASNAHLDKNEVLERQGRAQRNTTRYPGPTDDNAFKIMPREICLSFNDWRGGARRHGRQERASFVLSTLNGAFRPGDNLAAMMQRLQFAGLAGGDGATFDSTGQTDRVDLAVVRGGLITMRNTGTKRIENGALIYWSLPDPDRRPPARAGINKCDPRLLVHSMPYEPKLDQLSETTLRKLFARPPGSASFPGTGAAGAGGGNNNWEEARRWPLVEGAQNLRAVVMQSTLNALHVFLMSGIVRLDVEALVNANQRATNTKRYQAQDPQQRAELFSTVGVALGVSGLKKTERHQPITFAPVATSKTETSLAQFAADVFLAEKASAHLFPLLDGTHALPAGEPGKILRGQMSALSTLFASVVGANHFTTRRIFAKAITPADPGDDMDVLLGKYHA